MILKSSPGTGYYYSPLSASDSKSNKKFVTIGLCGSIVDSLISDNIKSYWLYSFKR